MKETSPPTNQRLPRSTIEPWFNNVGGKKLWIVIKHFSLRNTSKNTIIETVLALDRRHISWSSIPRLSLFNRTIVSFLRLGDPNFLISNAFRNRISSSIKLI